VPYSAVLHANSTTPRFFMQSLGQIAIPTEPMPKAMSFQKSLSTALSASSIGLDIRLRCAALTAP
jgi:hypothetical protein